MPSIISIFNKTLDTTTQNLPIDTSSGVDNALSDIKKNFFRLKHNVNFAKKYLIEHQQDIADGVGGIGAELGTLAAYHLGILTPSGDPIKTFKFNFNNKQDINLSFSIPSFNIYDTPPGLDIIDYVADVGTDCDYLDGDIILFPGVPCALPEIAMCKKTLTKKILGKRINLGTINYPCGYKQKTIGSIALNKSNTTPGVLFEFPGFDFNCVGGFDISGELIVEMTSGLPIELFTTVFKGFDLATYNAITNSGKNPITNIASTLQSIAARKPTFQWFLKFAKYAMSQTSPGISILQVCITSIKVTSTTTLKYFSATYGSKSLFNLNNLSYSEKNYELLQNGRYISFGIDTTANINLSIGLGSYQLGQLVKDADSANNFLGLVMKMINTEKNTLPAGPRLRELTSALAFLNDQLNEENIGIAPFRIPNFITMLKNVKNKVDLSLSLTINVLTPVPEAAFIATVNFTFAQIIEFIKQYLADYVVDVILASADAQMLLINLEKDVIENVIKPVKLPSAITSQINELNNKFDYARNLFKGYITIGIMESTSFLQQFIPNKNTNYTYNIIFPFV